MSLPIHPHSCNRTTQQTIKHMLTIPVTRSHKANDRDHKGLADGTALPVEHLPRYFAKSGYADADPKKIKKDGAGKGNWYETPS